MLRQAVRKATVAGKLKARPCVEKSDYHLSAERYQLQNHAAGMATLHESIESLEFFIPDSVSASVGAILFQCWEPTQTGST